MYQKPVVSIELEEYNELLKLKENQLRPTDDQINNCFNFCIVALRETGSILGLEKQRKELEFKLGFQLELSEEASSFPGLVPKYRVKITPIPK